MFEHKRAQELIRMHSNAPLGWTGNFEETNAAARKVGRPHLWLTFYPGVPARW